jgi:hypothetical protein
MGANGQVGNRTCSDLRVHDHIIRPNHRATLAPLPQSRRENLGIFSFFDDLFDTRPV